MEMEDGLLPPNVVIVGAWRSGTTLMFFLFQNGFRNVVTNNRESYALETLLPARYKWRVSKKPNDAHSIDRIYAAIDPYFIWMLRDPRDCIVSWKSPINDYHLNFEEWKRNNDCIEKGKSSKIIKVVYEDLVTRPEEVQNYMMDCIPGLEKRNTFSVCHKYFDPSSEIIWQLNGIRPPDETSIGKWREDRRRIEEQLTRYPEMHEYLIKYGYEKDASWQKELKTVSWR
jgi:hypothetical protein